MDMNEVPLLSCAIPHLLPRLICLTYEVVHRPPAALCHAVLCHAMLCYTTLCYAVFWWPVSAVPYMASCSTSGVTEINQLAACDAVASLSWFVCAQTSMYISEYKRDRSGKSSKQTHHMCCVDCVCCVLCVLSANTDCNISVA